MLANIRSEYITKKILSYAIKKNIIKIFKYNNYFKTKINITLKDYKIFSGRYIIYEAKGKGKEYEFAKLI